MQENRRFNRRRLVKSAALGLPVLACASVAARAFAESAPPAKADLKFVADNDPTATALHYVSDATKAQRVAKAGVEGKDQFCKGCQFYTKSGTIGKQEAGKCLMIPSGQVNSNGWCATWTKRA